jgi:hypothetical protein
VICVAATVTACGLVSCVDDPQVNVVLAGDGGNEGGALDDAGLDGNVATTKDAATMKDAAGSDAGDAATNLVCTPTCNGMTPVCVKGTCVECQPFARRCNGNTPQACDVTGQWTSAAQCSGASPVCTGGVCAPFALHGGIDTLGPRPTPGTIILKNDGLQLTPRSCAVDGGAICVSGGLTP